MNTFEVMAEITEERCRQIYIEGFSAERDDSCPKGELAAAAGCYLLFSDSHPNAGQPPEHWPWDPSWWKPKDYRRDLVRAGALIAAEIERVDRSRA